MLNLKSCVDPVNVVTRKRLQDGKEEMEEGYMLIGWLSWTRKEKGLSGREMTWAGWLS